ncbi:MAG: glycosyltransferase family 4 protein [Rhizobiaceae bacterium]|nr:glycosyltransferase family 4 protein [Rhizobiaceae bacterium]MCZ8352525.1 glycosyltransferase family 4 protein [Rhizobium sp.]
MKIWIINQYATLPSSGLGVRHRHLARELAALGHDTSVIAARWSHLTLDEAAADAAPQVDHFEGFRFLSLDLLRYRDAHDKKRALNWFLFAYKLLRAQRVLGEKPDAVVYSSPSLVGYLAAEWIARRCRARLIFEVRDIWPLSLTHIGGYSKHHPFIRLFQWIEDRAYRNSDLVVSNLRGAVDHMEQRGLPGDRFVWLPNGVSLSKLDQKESAPAALHAKIPSGKFVVGYAGTLGSANSINTLIDAARILRHDPEILFVLLGGGREKSALEERVRSEELSNVIFIESVPKAQVQDILKRFDACWIGWKSSPLYNYGIAANKIFDYLYSARPIIHSYSGRHDPVMDYNAGLSVPAEDPAALAAAIATMRSLPNKRRRQLGKNGRVAVLERHDYQNLARQLEKSITEIRCIQC